MRNSTTTHPGRDRMFWRNPAPIVPSALFSRTILLSAEFRISLDGAKALRLEHEAHADLGSPDVGAVREAGRLRADPESGDRRQNTVVGAVGVMRAARADAGVIRCIG